MSVDPPDVSSRLKDRLKSRFTFLSDPDGELLDELDIRHVSGSEGNDIAYPTQILVDGNGRIAWIYVSQSARTRASPGTVLRAIDGLSGRDDV